MAAAAAAPRRMHKPLFNTLSDPLSVVPAIKSLLQSLNPQNPQIHQNPNPAILNRFSFYLTEDLVIEVVKNQQSPYHSLFFFNWATNLIPNPNNYSHSHFCFVAIADKLLSHKQFSLAADLLKLHNRFSDLMVGKFIKTHGDLWQLKSCVRLFDEVRSDEFESCLFSFNSLLGVLVKAGKVRHAWGFFCNVVIKSCVVIPDVSTYTTMITGLFKVGMVEDAEKLFDEMPERNSRTYNAFINGLCKNDLVERAQRFLEQMVEDDGFIPDVVAYTTLIDGYCKKGEIGNALKVFDEMTSKGKCEPNVLTFNALINGLCMNGGVDEAKRMMSRMRLSGLRDNMSTHTSLLKGFCIAGRSDEAVKHFKEMGSLGMSLDLKSYSVISNEYCKMGRPEEAVALLREMRASGIVPRLNNCNSVLMSFVKLQELDKAVHFLKQMARWGCRPNFVSYNALIPGLVAGGCTKMQDLDMVVNDMIRDGVALDSTLYSLLIRAKCVNRDVQKAIRLFQEMIGKRVMIERDSFEVFVKELCLWGLVKEVEDFFDEMRNSGLVFDVVSYQSVLNEYVSIYGT